MRQVWALILMLCVVGMPMSAPVEAQGVPEVTMACDIDTNGSIPYGFFCVVYGMFDVPGEVVSMKQVQDGLQRTLDDSCSVREPNQPAAIILSQDTWMSYPPHTKLYYSVSFRCFYLS